MVDTKVCNHRKEELPIDAFAWRWKKRGIRQGACRKCQSKHQKKWIKKAGARHRANVRQNTEARRQEAREFIWSYLSNHPCVDCGESDPTVLEFDHVRGTKHSSISKLASQGYSIARLQKEIAKTAVRCANCHRKKTAKERGWFSG